MGITDYAQRQLGDVVFVELPENRDDCQAWTSIGEIESTRSVSELYAPVASEVMARNDRLADYSELVNSQPHGDGWIVELAAPNRPNGNGCWPRRTTAG